MFTVNKTLTEYPVLVKNVTLHLDEKMDFDVNVPVFNMKTEQDILDAIMQREIIEKNLYSGVIAYQSSLRLNSGVK
jgi:hypothetical protein